MFGIRMAAHNHECAQLLKLQIDFVICHCCFQRSATMQLFIKQNNQYLTLLNKYHFISVFPKIQLYSLHCNPTIAVS